MTSPKFDYVLNWYGGKNLLAQDICSHIPDHEIYVEVFGGGAAVLLCKQPSPMEVYNDLDEGLITFFSVIRDPDLLGRFMHLVSLTPYSRKIYEQCRTQWSEETDPVIKAWRWYVVARQSFSGAFGRSWGPAVTSASKHNAWLNIMDKIPRVAERFMTVIIECQDWQTIMERYKRADRPTVFYLDPPYLPESRRELGVYTHEMDEADHIKLIEYIVDYPHPMLLSGYQNPLYATLEERGWQRVDFNVMAHSSAKTQASGWIGTGSSKETHKRVESLWLNRHARKQGKLFNE